MEDGSELVMGDPDGDAESVGRPDEPVPGELDAAGDVEVPTVVRGEFVAAGVFPLVLV